MKECRYYIKNENLSVECTLCPRHCIIPDGARGYCRARYNEKGILYTENEYLSSIALDPIEKKPLFHFHPGKMILSIGGSGCNFRCSFCQNWQISQCENRNVIHMKPQDVVEKALELQDNGNIGIAYTYSDPIIMFEYVMETAELARAKGLKNVFVSNGYIEEEPLKDLLTYMDAFNIDVKAFTEEKYLENFKAKFSYMKRNLELIEGSNKKLEISCLIVPGVNDRIEEGEEFFTWLAGLNQEIPVHISRYFPCYLAEMPPTEVKLLMEMADIAKKYLKYVYIGNV